MERLTAAHRTLPFGTVVRVENRDNGRSIELRITDRGPFAKRRILDVSRAGARALGMLGPGTARVRIRVLEPGGDAVAVRGGCVVVQVASHHERERAEERRRALEAGGWPASLERYRRWYRVVVGPYRSAAEAEAASEALEGFVRRCTM